MGMFDYITDVPLTNCRKCGTALIGWQSKDRDCTLSEIPYWEVDYFYTLCEAKVDGQKCGEWHEYVRKRPNPRPRVPIEDYELSGRET